MATVRVRVAVAVDPEGGWYAIGGNYLTPQEALCLSSDKCEYGEQHYWLEAELEVPSVETVKAEVKRA